MGISCGCGDGYDWYYIPDEWFSPLDKKRARRCVSCNAKVNVGDECLKLQCYRIPNCEYEESRFGESVPLADKFYCEKCGEIFLNLNAYGYCISIGGSIMDDLKDHWEATGFAPQAEVKNDGSV